MKKIAYYNFVNRIVYLAVDQSFDKNINPISNNIVDEHMAICVCHVNGTDV